MPFEDESFDVVLSNAVLNEVANVDGLFEEIFRVTKGHGVSYHLWHNFYSFSGSYMPESVSLRYPWGHLRGKYRPRAALNKITPTEMRDLFSNYFELIGLYQVGEDHSKNDVGSSFRYERQDLLSESIRNELRAYPTELLLTRSYLIVGRKRD
jgi:ubiquinone/menaquinone biosynthesis C-methylase UbiE